MALRIERQNELFSFFDLLLNSGIERAVVAGTYRLEVMGIFSTALREQFKALGCFSEVIQYETRLFIPTDTETGVATLQQLLDWMQLAPAQPGGETRLRAAD